jgi:hypothetical protein
MIHDNIHDMKPDAAIMADIPLSVNPNGRAVVIVLGVFLALDYVFVFIRYWARHLTKRKLEFNDWALFAALVSL